MKLHVQNPWKRAFESFVVLLLYYAAGRAGLAVPFTSGNVSPIWPAAGIAIGGILIFGRHVSVGIAAGAFLVNLFSPVPAATALTIAVGNTLGPLIAAALLEKRAVSQIRRLSDLIYLVSCGALGLSITALIGPTALYLTGVHAWNRLPLAWLMWWLGDCIGFLLITPLMLNIAEFKTMKPRLAELALLLLWLFTGTAALLNQEMITEEAFAFALLPFIIWAAVRFSVAGAALAGCLVASVVIWETGQGAGPFYAYGVPLFDAGVLQMFLGVLSLSGLCLAAVIAERTSIQEALARERKLRLAQEQYRMIIETTNDGVWALDNQDRTTFVNQRMAEMLGYRPEEMLGHTPFDYVFPEDVLEKKADLERRRHGTGREVLYNRFRRKDGAEMWATLSTAPLFTESGKRNGALAMLSDVTLLRKAEDALRRNEKLVTAGRLAATISHELNNPLEAVVNLLYLLKMQPLNDQAKRYLELSEKEVQRIAAITRRTLGFFRDNSAWVELSVTDLLEDTLAFYEQRLTDHSILVVRDYRDRGTVSASRGELQQVFANLISNAIDAMNGSGRLTLRVAMASDKSGTEVVVEDDGSGIAADHLDRVFEPFFTTKLNTGTGLGLWVAKEIIQKHGGTISVSSKSGSGDEHGTRFCIFLPMTVDQRAAA